MVLILFLKLCDLFGCSFANLSSFLKKEKIVFLTNLPNTPYSLSLFVLSWSITFTILIKVFRVWESKKLKTFFSTLEQTIIFVSGPITIPRRDNHLVITDDAYTISISQHTPKRSIPAKYFFFYAEVQMLEN